MKSTLIPMCVSGIHTTCQWNTKIFYPDGQTPNLWSSDALTNPDFDEEKTSFYADGCAVTLNEDATAYTVKSATNEASIVNVTVTRMAPGFQVGKDGKTYFGTDPNNPWGSMRHAFWPRCRVEGSIVTKAGELDFKGRGYFCHALQGMKPHHAGRTFSRRPPPSVVPTDCANSRQVELHGISISYLLSGHHAIYNPTILRIDLRHRRRDCQRWRDHICRLDRELGGASPSEKGL